MSAKKFKPGLGFREDKIEPSALEIRLQTTAKTGGIKRKRPTEDVVVTASIDHELNGVVEDCSLSKVEMINKRNIAIKPISNYLSNSISLQKKRKPKPNSTAVLDTIVADAAAVDVAADNNQLPNRSGECAAESSSTAASEKPRKRMKTRSKQKNIRRDNRPDSDKPKHLRPGEDFAGRPLTEVSYVKVY